MEAQGCSWKVVASVSTGLMRAAGAQSGSHAHACILRDPAVGGGFMAGFQ